MQDTGATVAGAHLRTGRPAEEVVGLAEELEADLVVVGSRGLGEAKRLVTGSVSEGGVHHARCPVLVACGDAHVWPPARVVIADDCSEDARQAGELAAGIGGLFGAEGVLVQVYTWVLKSTQERGTLESRIVNHAPREAESELRDRADKLAPILGRSLDVKLVVDEAAEGVDGVALALLEEGGGRWPLPHLCREPRARGDPAGAGRERFHAGREGRRGSGPGLPARLPRSGRSKWGLTGEGAHRRRAHVLEVEP